jgi:DnaK suppressor protein
MTDAPVPVTVDAAVDSGESVASVESVATVLAEQYESTRQEIVTLSRDLAEIIEASRSVATDDEHDPEGATIAFERAQLAANLERARTRLGDLESAAARLAEGTYGRCETCDAPIAPGRLEARPSARTCISCAARG